ncbi:concanavalin A-like lectin/glucanase domain-containing protein [Crepidotus variabilis]|uniref:Concanavalin A-like lectin/glucanase domain-containing protein n=1 Tax=Crepidotus variabilis TaxID=179855 RepID=A0A9P6E9N3_9AGAR|nr:concanavalin A-like lectin/glucanase domain-containing protein [Crepidotus variabilis]
MHVLINLCTIAISLLSLPFTYAAKYNLVDEFAGQSFFDKFDFYGSYDNLTWGDVNYLDKGSAMSKKLATVNSAGNAVMKVATDYVAWNEKRDSIRITTEHSYPIGTVWITDVVHMPFGCSVWPAIWTTGETWPDQGEIDILEGINLYQSNHMALHTRENCKHSTSVSQTGESGGNDCSTDAGCQVEDKDLRSYGEGFNQAGGGVYATEFSQNGINIWFWSRDNIPSSIGSSGDSIESQDDWGTPVANYPSGSECDISKSFGPQKFIYNISLCGGWARNPSFYQPQCGWRGSLKDENACYNDNVVGDGSNYNEAYFEVKYLRAYAASG